MCVWTRSTKIITNLFVLILNNERHNYNTRHSHDLQISTGNGDIFYKLFSLYGVQIWNHINKIELMYHMHALRTYQNCTYKTMMYCIEYDKTLYYRLS